MDQRLSQGDPALLIRFLDEDAVRMDGLEEAIGLAADTLDSAEDAWLVHRDKIAEELRDEMRVEGRKSDPAEHWVDTQARKEGRSLYNDLRRAKRAVERLEQQRRAKDGAIGARQSELGALRDGFKVQPSQTPNGHTFGGRGA